MVDIPELYAELGDLSRTRRVATRALNSNQLGPLLRYAPMPEIDQILKAHHVKGWRKRDMKIWLKEHYARCLAWVDDNVDSD